MCTNFRNCACEPDEIDYTEPLPLKCGPCGKCRKKTMEMMKQIKINQPDKGITNNTQTAPERLTITRSRGENPAPLTKDINISELQQNNPDVRFVYQWVKSNQRIGHAEGESLPQLSVIIGICGTPSILSTTSNVKDSSVGLIMQNTCKL